MEILDARETAERLPYPALAVSIREVALAMGSGDVQAPPRFALPLREGGILLVMPASDREIAITKLVTVHPENPGRDLPTIQGEVVVMDDSGLTSYAGESPRPALCVFEYVYFARPDSRFDGREVAGARQRMGELLADEAPAEADVVIPVPDSGISAAVGYSRRSGIPYAEGLIKNRYVGRTFIQPTDGMRQIGLRLKLNPLPSVIKGRRVVVIDDSIVRGNTSRKLVKLLFEAGAKEVHFRVSSPPITGPCYYGIDMDTKDQLVGANYSVEEIRDHIGATTLAYLSTEAMIAATGRPKGRLCSACFDGDYPIPGSSEKFAFENRTHYAGTRGG